MLGLLGNQSSAATELLQAASAIKDPQLRYYAALFLGQVYAALGRDADARRQYETAAQLYPNAASPLFGLSELASRGGDPAASLLFVKRRLQFP